LELEINSQYLHTSSSINLIMAHQTHALPWTTLASNFKYNISYHSHPQRLDIHPQKKPNQAKDLAYFCKAFAKQIHDFGVTERAKYPPVHHYKKRASSWVKSEVLAPKTEENGNSGKPGKGRKASKEAIETRKVIPTRLIKRYPYVSLPHCDRRGQDVQSWLLDMPPEYKFVGYGNWIQAGEIIKILMMEASSAPPALSAETAKGDAADGESLKVEAMETLLLMASHPRMKILELKNMHHGHHFGVSRVAEEAIKVYIYLNLIIAMRDGGSDVCDSGDTAEGENEGKQKRKFMGCESYEGMLRNVAGSYDGDAQTLVHRVFFLGGPAESYWWGQTSSRDVLGDLEVLREYLKGIWRVMVIYDVIIREAGGDPTWEKECEWAFNAMFGVRYEMDY
jgi:hypothetical protein